MKHVRTGLQQKGGFIRQTPTVRLPLTQRPTAHYWSAVRLKPRGNTAGQSVTCLNCNAFWEPAEDLKVVRDKRGVQPEGVATRAVGHCAGGSPVDTYLPAACSN